MSFNRFKRVIEENDTVILCVSFNQYYPLEIKAKITNKKGVLVDNVFQTTYGALRCIELIGREYGSKVQLSKGHVYVLQPTPELWTLSLPHRTQIIYTPDISMIIHQLEVQPSSKVIESGTGSGSLSHALIRAIKPHGHLYTFDFHAERTQMARDEFAAHDLSEFVSVAHRDVCADGFGEALNNRIDAVFLDLPDPWQAIPHAVTALSVNGGRICSFSPCIEQVQKTCGTLNQLGFIEIVTMEVLQTQYAIQQRQSLVLDLSFLRTAKDGASSDNEKSVNNKVKESVKAIVAIPPTQQPGHTGYLTFATLLPQWSCITNE